MKKFKIDQFVRLTKKAKTKHGKAWTWRDKKEIGTIVGQQYDGDYTVQLASIAVKIRGIWLEKLNGLEQIKKRHDL